MGSGAVEKSNENLAGKIELKTSKQELNVGEIIEIEVRGVDLKVVNALSFALPYNADEYEFVAIQSLGMKQMENFTNDRLHTNRQKALYPTFVNAGDKETLNGSTDLFIIKMRAKKKLKFDLKMIDGIIVDKRLNELPY